MKYNGESTSVMEIHWNRFDFAPMYRDFDVKSIFQGKMQSKRIQNMFLYAFMYLDGWKHNFSSSNLQNMYSWIKDNDHNDVPVHIKTSVNTRNESSCINPSMRDSLL